MRTKIISVSTYILFISYGATQIDAQVLDGFWGMKFGSGIQDCKTAMTAKGAKLDDRSTNDNLIFTGVKFAGKDVVFIRMGFVDNEMHTAEVHFSTDDVDAARSFFIATLNDLNIKYFQANDYVYVAGKGEALWKFGRPEGTGENVITLSADEKLIQLVYQDGERIKAAIRKQQQKQDPNTKDY